MGRWIADWEPEDPKFWRDVGRPIARRNLIWSIVAENIGFSVWLLWSVTAARLPSVGFPYTTEQLFLLVAIPGLVGAMMRFPYTFAVPRFGGRNWTTISALLLFVPTTALAVLVSRPATPFWAMAVAAATAGLGGGNFASSMANISFFFPDREKGWALGLNAAGGNLGVSTVQLVVPAVIVVGGTTHLANAGLMWMPFIALAAVCAFLFMDNLKAARSSFHDQLAITKRKHTWIMSFLYIGTFGSFVGYSAAFPLLLKTQFPEVTANLAFLGALVGSVARPLGGKIADRLGGARVTLVCFGAMAAATLAAAYFTTEKSFPGFLAAFLALFVSTGIGNGSTYRMIPSIFRAESFRGVPVHDADAQAAAAAACRRDSAAALGFIAAVGALGGYFIPQGFSASIRATGGPASALAVFVAFYAVCASVTWWHYTRTSFAARIPSLAAARI